MHRNGYKGRKFGRERDERRALIKGLATAIIDHHEIETTLPKAKEIRPYVEKLVTKARKGGLHNRRQIISKVNTLEAAHKLVDEIAPQLKTRESGYLRITKTSTRKGDNTQMAKIGFVDKLKATDSDDDATEITTKKVETHVQEKQSAAILSDDTAKGAKPVGKAGKQVKTASRRTGVRGNK